MIQTASKAGAFFTLMILVGCWALGATQQTVGALLGGIFATVNLVAVIWALQKLFQKKSVALAVSVIVIKYTAWLGLFILLYSYGWQINAGFVIGLAVLFPTLGAVAYRHNTKSEMNGSF